MSWTLKKYISFAQYIKEKCAPLNSMKHLSDTHDENMWINDRTEVEFTQITNWFVSEIKYKTTTLHTPYSGNKVNRYGQYY